MQVDFSKLIPKEEALHRLLQAWEPILEVETIPLLQANGRVLAQDLYAQHNLPVVRASTMDGVAVQSSRFADGLPDTSDWKLGVDFVRADTGDDFADAFDTVIAIENVVLTEQGGISIPKQVNTRPGFNTKGCGADVRQGTRLLEANTRLEARAMAVAAMGGYAAVPVYRKPRVAFIPTGSELVPPGTTPERGQNIDSNSVLVHQMLLDMGAEPILHPIVRDDPAAVRSALQAMLAEADLVLVNAGTSKGGEDYCHAVLTELGAPLFSGIAAVPGRPMNAVLAGNTPVINLSGPAFAAFYSMDYVVRGLVNHALRQPMPQREQITATLREGLQKPPFFSMMSAMALWKTADGYETAPVSLRGPGSKGSAAALTAQAVYLTTPGEAASKTGERLTVELLVDRSQLPQA